MSGRDAAPAEALALKGILVRGAGRRGEPAPAPVLDVADLRVSAGERIALLGPNGAGKTTLLHVAALLRRPDAGTVRIGGEPATPANSARLRASLALLFQDPVLFAGNALDNAALGLRVRGVPRRDAERRASAWLDRFGVAHLAGRSRRALSGGEGQRVALARAFAGGPRLLLLDEPFAALDAAARATLLPELTAHLRAEGAAAVLVTHDPGEAMAFGDRLGIVRGGRLVQCDRPEDLATQPNDAGIAALLGCAGVISGIAARCADGGWRLTNDGDAVRTGSVAPGIAAGDTAVAVVQAGAIAVVRAAEDVPGGWNAIAARVTAVAPSPAGWRVVLAPNAGCSNELVAAGGWDRAAVPDPGMPAIAAFSPSATHLAAVLRADPVTGNVEHAVPFRKPLLRSAADRR